MIRWCATFFFSVLLLLGGAYAQSTSTPAYLQQAFYGTNELQSWYTPATGLYQTTGWWNAANALTVLANYSRLDGTNAYFPIFANTYKQAALVNPGYVDGYYDDAGWWALMWIDAYDLTRQTQYLTAAQSIFTYMTGAWDNTCGGGIWWNTDRQYKNAIANELFLSVAAELAARANSSSQQSTYLNWAEQEWTWFQGSGMINSENLINDGLVTATCQNNGEKTWSYNQGVILGGLTQLNALTHNNSLLTTAQTIANAAITHLVTATGILTDTCEPNCGQDGVQFKGVFLRNLMALQAVVHDPQYTTFTENNAESIWTNSQGPNYAFGQAWEGPFDAANAGSQSSALDAFLAAASMQPGALGTPGAGASAASFTLTASPSALNLTGGSSAMGTVTLNSANGFSDTVSLTATVVGAPAGVTATLGSTSLSGSGQTSFSVSTTGGTPGGSYLVAVTGVSGNLAQTAYVTLTLPDFSLSTASGAMYVNQNGGASNTLTATPSDSFDGDVDFSLSTLPPGVTGSFAPQTTSATSTLNLHAGVLAPTTSGRTLTITGTSGPTVHTAPALTVAVSAAAGECGLGTPVSLAASFNLTALRSDGTTFTDGGLDGLSSAYSADLLGTARVWNGIRYTFGASDAPDAVYGSGQTIALPQGNYNALQLLGTGINGDQAGQVLTVTYTDGSTTKFSQSFSDWFTPGPNVNEGEAVAMAYRNTSNGTAQQLQFNLYGYTLELNASKTVKSVTLPDNRNLILLAATLSSQDFGREINLANAFNATGIYTDGLAFPSTGGLDGGGYAYSANALQDTAASGEDVVVGASHFHLAAAGTPNVVYAAGQTISLPLGFYQDLQLLGTGVEGDQAGQAIRVNYYDGSSSFVQGFSDWSSLGSNANESLAIQTSYRNTNTGSPQAEAFNLYLYTLALNPLKPVKSITLPVNRYVVLLGMTLTPPSIFELEPFVCSLF